MGGGEAQLARRRTAKAGRGGKTLAANLLLGFEYETLDGVRFLLSPTFFKGGASGTPLRAGKERKEKTASAAALVIRDLPLYVSAPVGGASTHAPYLPGEVMKCIVLDMCVCVCVCVCVCECVCECV
jgi:hypothetical protein